MAERQQEGLSERVGVCSGDLDMRYGPLPVHHLHVSGAETPPFIMGSFDSIGPMSRASFPHRHSFHEIVYVTGGRGNHVVDLARWPLRPPHLCFIAPGQVHYWEQASQLQGWVVLFTDDFLINHPGDGEAFQELADRPWLKPEAEAAQGLTALLQEMGREFAAHESGYASVLQAYLHVLVTRARRWPGTAAPDPGADRRTVVAREFARLLAHPGKAQRTVHSCAEQVGVSVSYLNDAVKRTTGRTPGQLIRRVQVLEAKRLLARTDLTVRQVANRVGFADPAYFCRFFRREAGYSPGDFRRAAHGNHHARRVVSIDGPDEPE
ncbi:AraC family transcriptional regulator [Streptomyces sp. KR80]|uniref:AraC family transcriptional regulator n=1 Tax=Streptomyces sp. KR80 TaxID=3457426 RepID=UPI003FD04127